MTPEEITAVLHEVLDPEIGVNIVDLGLVYEVEVPAEDRVRVAMTMTTPACPLGDYMEQEVRAAVRRRFPDVAAVQVQLVWDPPWGPHLMSPAARRQLGWER